MREKIALQDFTVLLVCPSQKWSTIERRAIFDCIYLRNIGGNPVLLCHKNSQLDLEAEKEDIERIYISKSKITFNLDINFLFEFKKLIKENRFDIVHCYSLSLTWLAAFVLKSNQKIPLFYTLNQHVPSLYHGMISKWLLRRVDNVFTFSDEIKDFACETFNISTGKVKSLGGGLEVYKQIDEKKYPEHIGCIINNLNELKRLSYIVKVFRVLKSHGEEKFHNLKLHIFLGPRIYQKDKAKKVLSEIDYEFYEGDIFLLSLEAKQEELKNLDLLIGTAFDEPYNDYEIVALMHEIPVLFPRTAMRQSLLFKYHWAGESYLEGDIREAKVKISKIINNFSVYKNALKDYSEEISSLHGIDTYAQNFHNFYETSFVKRYRFSSARN